MPDRHRFTREATNVVSEGWRRAANTGSSAVEPRHLLAALAVSGDTAAARALSGAGLDPETIDEAAARDDIALLAGIGVRVDEDAVPPRAGRTKPKLAPATKRALELSYRIATERRDRDIGADHILLGLLRLDTTRIPQILEATGTTAEALAASLEPART